MTFINSLRRSIYPAVLAAALCAALLGGCSGNKVSTEKTQAGYKAAEDHNYQEAEGLFTEAVAEGEEPVAAYRGIFHVSGPPLRMKTLC